MHNYANDTVNEASIGNEKSANEPRVIITGCLIVERQKGLSKDSRVKINNFPS